MKMPTNVMGLYGFENKQAENQDDPSKDQVDMSRMQEFYGPAYMGMMSNMPGMGGSGGMGMGMGFNRGGSVDDPMSAARRIALGSGGRPDAGFDYGNSMRMYYDLINSGKMTPQAAAAYVGNF